MSFLSQETRGKERSPGVTHPDLAIMGPEISKSGMLVIGLGVIWHCYGFPGGSDSKVSAYNVGDSGSIPGLGRSPGAGHGNPLQYSCLDNPMDRGAWWAAIHRVAKESDTTY